MHKKVSVINSLFIVLLDFFLRDFSLTQLENYIFLIDTIIFVLTLLGTGDPWPHLSSAEG
jgi:hypothetical protein